MTDFDLYRGDRGLVLKCQRCGGRIPDQAAVEPRDLRAEMVAHSQVCPGMDAT